MTNKWSLDGTWTQFATLTPTCKQVAVCLARREATGSRSVWRKRNKRMGNPIRLFLVRKTGLEPVQCELHAPQTCASASSATSAYKTPFIYYTEKVSVVRPCISAANIWYYTLRKVICQYLFEKNFDFLKIIFWEFGMLKFLIILNNLYYSVLNCRNMVK